MKCVKKKPRHRLEETASKTRPEQINAKRPYSQLAQMVAHCKTGDAMRNRRNRSMCLPLPLVLPSIIHRHPVSPYESQRQVQNETPRHRLEDAPGTSKARPERSYDTSFSPGMRAPQPRVAKDPRNIRPQTRVGAIKRGTSKRCCPPATIYPRDQSCRGHVEKQDLVLLTSYAESTTGPRMDGNATTKGGYRCE